MGKGRAVSKREQMCRDILEKLLKHPRSSAFRFPVDVEGLGLTDYNDIVKKPMDLGTVKKKITNGNYGTGKKFNHTAFASDVHLVFRNNLLYHPVGTDIHDCSKTLDKLFRKLWDEFNDVNKLNQFTYQAKPTLSRSNRNLMGDMEDEDVDVGYESDDSFMPPQEDTNTKASRLKRLGVFMGLFSSSSSKELTGNDHSFTRKVSVNKFSDVSNTAVRQFRSSIQARQDSHQNAKLPTSIEMAKKFDNQERISVDDAVTLLVRAQKLMQQEPNIVDLSTNFNEVIIVGDLHGQYYDLRELFRISMELRKAREDEKREKILAQRSSVQRKQKPRRQMRKTTLKRNKGKKKNEGKQRGQLKKPPGYSDSPVVEKKPCEFNPGTDTYVFLGDYVDRGAFSCEILLYLLALKIEFPTQIILLRGNHECDTVASYFGFKGECDRKYGRQVYNQCLLCFQAMPIAASIVTDAGKFLCCHGGLSPNITLLSTIEKVHRFREPGVSGALCDLLWSDPVRDDDMIAYQGEQEKEKEKEIFRNIDYFKNSTRGCSYRYGFHATDLFLKRNNLTGLIRAHEVQEEGYRYHFRAIQKKGVDWNKVVVTVFSAPNYCDRYHNKASFMRLLQSTGKPSKPLDVLQPVQFSAAYHPLPIYVEDETAKLYQHIDKHCPYMPSTLNGFLRSAITLGHEYGTAMERKNLGRHRPSVVDDSEGLGSQRKLRSAIGKLQVLKVFKGKSANSQHFDNARAADELNEMHPIIIEDRLEEASHRLEKQLSQKSEKRGSLPMPRKSIVGKFENIIKRNSLRNRSGSIIAEEAVTAAKSLNLLPDLSGWIGDQINEDIPATEEGFFHALQDGIVLCRLLKLIKGSGIRYHFKKPLTDFQIQENFLELQQASARLELRYPLDNDYLTNPKQLGSFIEFVVGILKLYNKQHGEKVKPQNLEHRTSSYKILRKIDTAPKLENVIGFSKSELLTLELLFMLIDHDGDGKISAEELVFWSKDDVSLITDTTAKECIKAVDFDADGFIGEEDFLTFAGQLKELWLLEEKEREELESKTMHNNQTKRATFTRS